MYILTQLHSYYLLCTQYCSTVYSMLQQKILIYTYLHSSTHITYYAALLYSLQYASAENPNNSLILHGSNNITYYVVYCSTVYTLQYVLAGNSNNSNQFQPYYSTFYVQQYCSTVYSQLRHKILIYIHTQLHSYYLICSTALQCTECLSRKF